MTEIEFRQAEANDRDSILALRARCFPDDDPEKQDARFWQWEFQRSPAGPGRMFVAESGGRIVTHFAFVPQAYVTDGAARRAVMALDAMTDPDWRGRGVYGRLHAFAIEAVKNEYAFGTAYQIRPKALPPLLRNGWTPRLKAPVLVRPLSWRALAGRAMRRPPSSGELHRTDLINPVALADIARDFFAGRVHQDRTAEFLMWRYSDSPIWKYDVVAGQHAFAVTRRTRLRGFDTLALVDVAWRRGCAREAKELMRGILRRAAAAGVEVAAALITVAHPAFSVLLRLGFLPGPHRFLFLLRDFDGSSVAMLDRARWALTWGDTDHL